MLDITFLVRDLVLFLLIALTVILVTRRLAVPYTLGLVVVGLLLSLFGLLPEAQLTPQLVLFVFLPALLFEGAWTIKGVQSAGDTQTAAHGDADGQIGHSIFAPYTKRRRVR